jgi:ankyrin repeat protein
MTEDEEKLLEAVKQQNIEKVKQLLDSGIDPEIKDRYNRTPLMVACTNHDIGIIELLLERKVNIHVVDEDGMGILDLVEPDIEHDSNPYCYLEYTPLSKYIDILRRLLKAEEEQGRITMRGERKQNDGG